MSGPVRTLPSAGVAADPRIFGGVGTTSNVSPPCPEAGADTGPTTGRSKKSKSKSKSKKRKRSGNATTTVPEGDADVTTTEEDTPAQPTPGLSESNSSLPTDFFGSALGNRITATTGDDDDNDNTGEPKISRKKQKREAAALAKAQDLATYIQPHEQNVQVLAAHKIKVTVLSDGRSCDADRREGDVDGDDETAAGSKKKEKKKSKKKGEEAEAKRAEKNKRKVQLFPQPLTSFSHLPYFLDVAPKLWQNIQVQGYDVPTEVQLATIPLQVNLARALTNSVPDRVDGDGVSGSNDTSLPAAPFTNILTVAPTGSGKTLAFLIPAVQSVLDRRRREGTSHPSPHAIVLAPTKELASQIVNEGRKLALNLGVRVTLFRKGMKIAGAQPVDGQDGVIGDEDGEGSENVDGSETSSNDGSDAESDTEGGGVSVKPEIPPVKADIIVSTPLLLLHSLQRDGATVLSLPTIRHLILDEADVLLDPLFRDQTVGIWRACTSPDLRSSLWSATMASTVEEVAAATLAELRSSHRTKQPSGPVEPSVAAAAPPPLIRVVVGLKDTALPTIEHRLIYAASEQGKLLGIRQLLRPTAPTADQGPVVRPPFIIFTQTIPRAIALYAELRYDIPAEAGGSARIAVLHSDLTDSARDTVMAGFRRGDVWVLITTDLLARGVDFRGVNGVVNYDIPTSAVSYIHRVGRTGRAGRAGGVAVTYYTKDDIPYVRPLANIIAASEKLGRGGGGDTASTATTTTTTIPQWMLDALPAPSKDEKRKLKRRGVEARRVGLKDAIDGGKKGAEVRISTKSGFDRRMENRRKQSREAAVARKMGGGGGGDDDE